MTFNTSKISNILKGNGLYLLAFILVLPLIYSWYKSQENKVKISDITQDLELQKAKQDATRIKYKNTAEQLKGAQKITSSTKLHTVASNIAHYLGTANDLQLHIGENLFSTDWLRGITEDEDSAYNEFTKITVGDVPTVAKLYNEVYAIGHNLQEDCRKYMPNDMYLKIKWGYKK